MREETHKKLIKFCQDFQHLITENKLEIIYDKEIKDWEIIKKLIIFYANYDNGYCLVDFIDQGNWDNVTATHFIDNSRTLELVWRDYTKIEENKHDEDIRQFTVDVFGGVSKISLYLSIDSICISKHKGVPVLLIKGFYKKKTSINKELNTKCSGFRYLHNGLFSNDILKLVKGDIHKITIPKINCYTVSLVPKYAHHIDAIDSKNFIYKINISISEIKIRNMPKEISLLSETDTENIKNRGNQIRREFEHILKIFYLRHHEDYKFIEEDIQKPTKDIQKLMLGDLISILNKSNLNLQVPMKIEEAVEILNECSHSSGVPITRGQLLISWSTIFLVVSHHAQWMNSKVTDF